MNHIYVKENNVLDAGTAREFALRRVIHNNGKLFEEFRMDLGEDYMKLSGKELIAAMDLFVKRKNFKIVNEKPVVRLDTERNWYRVDVIYTIEV